MNKPKPERSRAKSGGDRLLQAALGSMPYGFSVWDEKFQLILYNRLYLKMYSFPEGSVRIGMTLREMSKLTVAVGNHPGFTEEELYAIYAQRLRSANDPEKIVRSQKPVRERVIRTNHIRSPGLGWIVTHEDVTEDVGLTNLAHEREVALQVQNQLFEAAVENMSNGLSMYDAEWRLVICNRRYVELYGIPPELARPGTPFKEIMAQRQNAGTRTIDLGPEFVDVVLDATRQLQSRVQTYRLTDGRVVSVTQSPLPQGGFIATHQDITLDIERIETLNAQREELASRTLRFEAAVNNISQGLCMFDAEERLVICNAAYARMYRLPPELTQRGTPVGAIIDFRFANGMAPAAGDASYISEHRRLVTSKAFGKNLVEQQDGRTIMINHHPMVDGGWVATHEDITEQRQNEARIQHLARHDALTDLPNRIFFSEEMQKADVRLKRGEIVAVLCINLDHFKSVNDTLGHAVGDRVLAIVGERLHDASRESDLVARLGGDEFAILLGALEGPDDAAAVAGRVVKLLGEPIDVDGQEVTIGGSVGIAVAPTDGGTAEILLKNADLALYRAKAQGRGNYHFFEKGMDQALQHRRALEQGLKIGLARGEFRLMFQPLINLKQNRICCLEALLRWDHPEHGLVSPGEFIPLAEETGMIVPIGEWVLREACRAATVWPEDVHIAVNLSPIQFKNRALVNQVTSALSEAGLDPRRLELEVTESLLLSDSDVTLETLHSLRALGVRIAMDDFGTGYSSLSYLRSFPFDKIKIDRSFMTGLTLSEESMAIIKAMIGLGRSLGMATTAEGIETEDQLSAVRAEGCDEVQGFLFSPPITASGVDALLAAPAGTVGSRTHSRRSR